MSVTDYQEIFNLQIKLICLRKPCVTDCIMADSLTADHIETPEFIFITLHQLIKSQYHGTPPEGASARILRNYLDVNYVQFQLFFFLNIGLYSVLLR